MSEIVRFTVAKMSWEAAYGIRHYGFSVEVGAVVCGGVRATSPVRR